MSFKVGDRIKIIKDTFPSFEVGDIGIIKECSSYLRSRGYDFRVGSLDGKHSDLAKASEVELIKRGRPRKEKPVKYIVFYDEINGDPAKKFISRKELVNWIKEAKENKNIVFDSIEVYLVGERLEVKIKTNVSLKKSRR